jgi:hypothetical protein
MIDFNPLFIFQETKSPFLYQFIEGRRGLYSVNEKGITPL